MSDARSPYVVLWCLLLVSTIANAGETIQRGFYSHEPDGIDLGISAVRSGELCTDATGSDTICSIETAITVTGQDTCIGDDGNSYPCTRYGYRYEYDGATPGMNIECTATRRDPFQSRQQNYSLTLDDETGAIFYPISIGYGPVERRTMLTEVHDCSYDGEQFATIEYIITYEPSNNPVQNANVGPDPNIDEPYIAELPQSCEYLTANRAARWLNDDVQPSYGSIEHIGNLRSHCGYTGIHGAGRNPRIEFKFHLYDLFDIEKLSPMQITFHAAFAGGGNEPTDVLDDPGKISFVFEIYPEITVLSVVTGFQGPADGAGRPREMLAHYYFQDPDRSHKERLECLLEFAEQNMAFWQSTYGAIPPRVPSGPLPEWPIGRCGNVS